MAVLSRNWNMRIGGDLSGRFKKTVGSERSLKGKIGEAEKRLNVQIEKLESIHTKLGMRDQAIMEKITAAMRENRQTYAKAYAGELAQVRKMKTMVGGAKLNLEQVRIRLNTVSEMGDLVLTLSPCMSIVKGLHQSLGGFMPGAETSMRDFSSMLQNVMSESAVGGMEMDGAERGTEESNSILEEAQMFLQSQTDSKIPDLPASLGGTNLPDAPRTREKPDDGLASL